MPRFFRHISASAFQFGLNQALGLLLFYALSQGLDKTSFGELNWALAVCMTAFALLGVGLDSLVVKKIASGEPTGKVLSLYRLHVRQVGAGAYVVLLSMVWFFPAFFDRHYFLLWIALAKTLLFWSLPYKQLAAGRERFGILMRMSVGSSVLKACAILVAWGMHQWSVPILASIFIAGDAVEWLVSAYLGRRLHGPADHDPAGALQTWWTLLREALPQAGVVLFSSAMARFDWIFIGLFVSAARLAEYSFAYKAFEVSSLPLLIIAPLLLPAFARWVKTGADRSGDLRQLLKMEIILACATVVWLNLAWVPATGFLRAGMYGAVNAKTILILSLCLPLLYLNNFLWSLHFAHGRLRWILTAFAAGFVFNVAGDIVLIPLYGNEGAAGAFLGAIVLQTLLYHRHLDEALPGQTWLNLGVCAVCAGISALGAIRLFTDVWAQVACATLFYGACLVLTGRIGKKDIQYVKLNLS